MAPRAQRYTRAYASDISSRPAHAEFVLQLNPQGLQQEHAMPYDDSQELRQEHVKPSGTRLRATWKLVNSCSLAAWLEERSWRRACRACCCCLHSSSNCALLACTCFLAVITGLASNPVVIAVTSFRNADCCSGQSHTFHLKHWDAADCCLPMPLGLIVIITRF